MFLGPAYDIYSAFCPSEAARVTPGRAHPSEHGRCRVETVANCNTSWLVLRTMHRGETRIVDEVPMWTLQGLTRAPKRNLAHKDESTESREHRHLLTRRPLSDLGLAGQKAPRPEHAGYARTLLFGWARLNPEAPAAANTPTEMPPAPTTLSSPSEPDHLRNRR